MDRYRRSLQGVASLYERPDWRRGILIPYAACCAIALLMLLFGGPVNYEVVSALVLQVIVGTLVALAPRLSLDRWPYGGSLAIVAYLVSVALLRDGGGPTAGFGPLVLLPVIWASVRWVGATSWPWRSSASGTRVHRAGGPGSARRGIRAGKLAQRRDVRRDLGDDRDPP